MTLFFYTIEKVYPNFTIRDKYFFDNSKRNKALKKLKKDPSFKYRAGQVEFEIQDLIGLNGWDTLLKYVTEQRTQYEADLSENDYQAPQS